MPERDDEFYVGWAAMPPGLGRFVRRALALTLGGVAAAALLATAAQAPVAPSVFEYGEERELVGTIAETPVPSLVVDAPACTTWCAAATRWPLAHYQTKRGAGDLVRGLDGRRVRLRGVLAYRGERTLLDVVPGSIEPLEADGVRTAASAPPPRSEDLGVHSLRGEIVDAKCHFGVMRPGDGKAHRSCAARCIASGSPAMLWVRDAEGRERHLLLTGDDGRALGRELLPLVAEPVAVTGRVLRLDGLLVLRAEPGAFRRRE